MMPRKIRKTIAQINRPLRIHTPELLADEHGTATIMGLVGIAVAIIALVAIFSIAGVIGYNIDTSVTIPEGSHWNTTNNTDLKSGYDIWKSTSGLIVLAAIVSIIAVVLAVLLDMIKLP